MRRALPLVAVAFVTLLLGLTLRIEDPAPLNQLRNIAFDTYQRAHPRAFDPDLPVRILAIDEASLDSIGQWPWPRARLAELTDRLTDLGAAAIAFDFIFAEPDRMSRDQIAGLLPEGPERARLLAALADLPDGDARLAQALSESPSLLGVVLGAGSGRGDTPAPKAGFSFAGDNPAGFLPRLEGVQWPLPALAGAASGLAALNWIPTRDQVVREVPLFFEMDDGALLPGLASEALRVAQGTSGFVLRASNASGQSALGARTGVNAARIGAFTVNTTRRGGLLLHFSEATPDRRIPAWRVLEGAVAPEELAGMIVLVGATAPGLFDLQATPIEPAVPGIDINAQAIEHLITGTALARPDWAGGLEIALFAGLTLAFCALAAFLSPLQSVLAGTATLSALVGGSFYAFVNKGLLIDPTFPAFASMAALFAATSWVAIRERADRQWVRHAFGRYVSNDLVERLVRNPERLALGGELRSMTILFTDIRGFTTRAEGMNAQELTGYVNDFLSVMTDVIVSTGGTVDKYIGDSIMAFWNAPLDQPDHAARACTAALGMRRALVRFNRDNAGRYPETEIGIGINTGICCVGNLGSQQRFDYSVIGDTVNIAARLESTTKSYGVPILVGPDTAAEAAAQGHVLVRIDDVRVKGRDAPIGIHMLLGGPDAPVADPVRAVLADLSALPAAGEAGDPDGLAQVLRRVEAAGLPDFAGVAGLYRKRLERMERNG